jgi:hypothetical protein
MVRAGAQLTGRAEGPGRLLTRRGRLNRHQRVLLAPRSEEVLISESHRNRLDGHQISGTRTQERQHLGRAPQRTTLHGMGRSAGGFRRRRTASCAYSRNKPPVGQCRAIRVAARSSVAIWVMRANSPSGNAFQSACTGSLTWSRPRTMTPPGPDTSTFGAWLLRNLSMS